MARDGRIDARLRVRGLLLLATILCILPASASAAVETRTFDVGLNGEKSSGSAPLSVGGYEVQQEIVGVPHPDFDPNGNGSGFVTRMEVDIVDADGNPIPISRLMLHHIVFVNASDSDNTCTNILGFDNRLNPGFGRERFFAAGEERSKMVLPEGYGYRLRDAHSWVALYMLMNHKQQTDEAYIRYTVTTVSGPDATGIEPVEPYWLDVQNCRADPIYNVPGTGEEGSTHEYTYDLTMPAAGNIVAGAGHVHGGARMLTLTQPGCADRQLARSVPTWGAEDHPFYTVRPVLHEPGPVNMSAFSTQSGIPVSAGETVRLNSLYEASRPHVRVMGIMVLYVDHDVAPVAPCSPIPGDVQTLGSAIPGRPGPIPFRIPLTALKPNLETKTIKRPPGETRDLRGGSTIEVGDRYFSAPNARVRRGTKLNWRFSGEELHNLTLANGPVGIGSPNLDDGREFAYRFKKRGTYRFFCGLHPVTMHERVVVPKRKRQRG